MKPTEKEKTPLEEIREIRNEIAAEFQYDVSKMFRALRRREKKSGHRLILPPKRATKRRQKTAHK